MIKRHTISFVHAAEGIWYAVCTQPNFIIHLVISLSAIVLGKWVDLSTAEWEIIVLTIIGGLVIELINTAIETTVDLIIQETHPLAKIAKDCASAAMLVYALGATVIAGIIFIPKIWPFS